MTYATVMVSLALDQPNGARLQVASGVAERFKASIIGIAAAQFAPPLYFTDGDRAQGLIDQGEASVKKRLAELEMQFREATRNLGVGVEWRSAVDFPARFIAEQARCADIIISGGHSPAISDAFSVASPKDLVMQAGRPLLVVPDTVDWLDLRRVVVAWKDTPEARRAVVDALPMLREAKEVSVIQILEADEDRSAALARVNDVVAWLSRHSISASGSVSEAGRNAVAQVDAVFGEVGASLIVAGAYGHSRFRELILGGVTQYLVTQSARCVLLSR